MSRRAAKPAILVMLFAVAVVAWTVAQGWTTTAGLVSFVLLVLGAVGAAAQRFAG
jgi:hypothetical protein